MVKLVLKEKKTIKEAANVGTYGDLRKAINSIINKEKVDAGTKAAINGIIGAIPGIGNAKSAYDVIKNVYAATDDKKTKTFLDKINVDDEFSKIVDDKLEMAFLKVLEMLIKSKPDNESLENFNVNKELVNYLSANHNKRTLAMVK